MKQTNSAIKFLMAQYRAIFNNAYFKGLATAAVVTAAMAAGQAQAEDLSSKLVAVGGTPVDIATSSASDTLNVSGQKSIAANITVGAGHSLTTSGDLVATGNLTVNSGSTLTVSGSGSIVLGTKDASGNVTYKGDLTATSATLNLSGSNIGAANFDINGGAITLTSGGKNGTNLTANGTPVAQDAPQATGPFPYNAVGTLTDVTATVNGGTHITAIGHLDITGSAPDKSQITLTGAASGSNKNYYEDFGLLEGSKQLTIKNTTLNVSGGVATSKGTALASRDLAVTDSIINIDGANDSLTLGSPDDIKKAAGETVKNAEYGKVEIKGSEINIKNAASQLVLGADGSKSAISFNGNTITNNGVISVFSNKVSITEGELTGSGSIVLNKKGAISINQSLLDGFANTDKKTDAGTIKFSGAGSKVTFTDADYVELSKYEYGSGASADFDIDSKNGVIKGNKLAISKAVTGTFTTRDGKIDLGADYIKLGGTASGDSNKLSEVKGTVFKTISAYKNIDFQGADNKFIVDSSDIQGVNKDANTTAEFTGADLTFEKGRLFALGNWKSAQNISLGGADGTSHGNVIVGNGTKYDSSLVLTGTITNAKSVNTWGALKAAKSATNTNTLDITGATLASSANPGMVSIVAEQNGIVKLTGEQVSAILDSTNKDTKGFHLGVTSGGVLDIQGEFTADFDDIIKGTDKGATDSNKLTLGGKNADASGVIKANKANLSGKGELNLQGKTADAVKLQLEELAINHSEANQNDVTVKSGTVVLSKSLSSENKNLIIADGAALELNSNGSVAGKLETITVSSASTAALKINGNWDMGKAGLVVNNSGAATIAQGASLKAATLTTEDSGTVTLDGAKMTVTGAVKTADNSVKVNNESTFTADYTQANSGTALGKAAVDATSLLELTNYTYGSIALDALNTQKGKFLSGNTGLFKITGKNGASLNITGTKADSNGNVAFTDAQNAANLEGVYSHNTVTGVTGKVDTTNDWGSVELDQGTTALDLGTTGAVHLNGANGKTNLVANKDGTAANVQLGDTSMLIVNASGTIKDIKAAKNNNGTVLVNDNVQLTVGNVGANSTAVKNIEIDQSSKLTAQDVFVQNLDLAGNLKAKDVTVTNLDLQGTATAQNFTINTNAGTELKGTLDVAKKLSASGDLTILNSVKAGEFVGANDKTVYVGKDGANGAAGIFDVGTLNLQGGNLIIDPDFNKPASLGFVGGDTVDDVVTTGGNIGLGKNAAFFAGLRNGDAEVQAILARYTNAIGSFDKNGNNKIDANQDEIGALFVANATQTVGDNNAVIVDPAKDSATLSTDFTKNKNKFVLAKDGALFVTDSFAQSILNKADKAVIEFKANTGGVLSLTSGSKIIIDTALTAEDSLDLVMGGTNSTVTGMTADTVIAANGLLQGTIGTDGKINFTLEEAKARAKLYNQSQPVQDLTIKALEGKTFDKTDIGIDYILTTSKDFGGKAAEATAHLAVYGGAVHGTDLAQKAATDAVADRMNRANPNGSLVFANNAQGGGLWLSPVYKSHESDSFDSDGVDYGVDGNIAGIVLGADSTTASGVRVGGYFNFGAADFDGQGVGDQVSNEADYFGFGLYAGMTFGQMSLVADAGFTQVSNDIEQNTGNNKYSKVSADVDSSAVTLGLRGEYKLSVATMDVTPHLGVRYTRLDVDGYDAKVGGKVLASTDFDTMQMFSIPFGVTVSKDIAAGAWTIKPVFDLTLTANAGDTDAKLTTTYIGAPSLDLTSEAFDSFTYGATFGLDAKYGENFSIGLNTNYVGSSNADEFGVMGNARYMF